MEEATARWDGRANLYLTLNPVDPALLARASNRIVERAEHTTADQDILRRDWLFVDIDPVRPSGISASGQELGAARSRAEEIVDFLAAQGWPDPILVMSGNGYNALYRIDLPNDSVSLGLVKDVLEALAARFNDDRVKVDTSVANAARIIGLAGTLKVKGENLPDRPHRRSQLERVPDPVRTVPVHLLRKLAATAAPVARGTAAPPGRGRLAEMLMAAGIEYREQPPDAAGIVWHHVKECPFHGDEGRSFECGVGEGPDGRFAGKCFHDRGQGKGWREWKSSLGLGGSRNGHTPLETARDGGDHPVIIISGRHLHEIAEDAWGALRRANVPPGLFLQGGSIARVATVGDAAPRIVRVDEAWLRGHLDRIATWVSRASRNDVEVEAPARPPRDVVEDLMAMNEGRLPALRGVTATPTLSRDGRLATNPGYQAGPGLYYAPAGALVPEVAERPSEADVERARALLLDDWLVDFPFADPSSRAHAVAISLTAVVRELIDGPTPLFAVDAPTPGSGKGLLAQTAGLIATGAEPAVTTEARDEDEFRKRVTAALREGRQMILLDNVKRRLDSGVLAAALTSTIWQDRLLGSSESLVLPNRAVWVATGNNLQLEGEIVRRAVWVRLDSKVDRPWERSGFRHDPLLGWVRGRRHELVWALLVLARRWIALGRPSWRGKAMGSFEAWCDVVGGILQAAGIEGFLANRDELYRRVDAETEEWRAFVDAWWAAYGDTPTKAGELSGLIVSGDLLPSLFVSLRGEPTERQITTRLGQALAQRRDRRIGSFFLRNLGHDSHRKGTLYALDPAEPWNGGAAGSAEGPHHNTSSPDASAEPAELAEPFPAPSREGSIVTSHIGRERTPEEVPHVPQHPPPDSTTARSGAEPRPLSEPEVPQVPRCRRCGSPMSVARVSDVCGRCRS